MFFLHVVRKNILDRSRWYIHFDSCYAFGDLNTDFYKGVESRDKDANIKVTNKKCKH